MNTIFDVLEIGLLINLASQVESDELDENMTDDRNGVIYKGLSSSSVIIRDASISAIDQIGDPIFYHALIQAALTESDERVKRNLDGVIKSLKKRLTKQ